MKKCKRARGEKRKRRDERKKDEEFRHIFFTMIDILRGVRSPCSQEDFIMPSYLLSLKGRKIINTVKPCKYSMKSHVSFVFAVVRLGDGNG